MFAGDSTPEIARAPAALSKTSPPAPTNPIHFLFDIQSGYVGRPSSVCSKQHSTEAKTLPCKTEQPDRPACVTLTGVTYLTPDRCAFEFVILASLRTKQLMSGCLPRVSPGAKLTTTATREVLSGKVARLVEAGEVGMPPIRRR